jgi:hypothetical protein
MSFSKEDRNFRAKAGKSFPIRPSADVDATLADVIADALRADFGTSPAKVKHLARLTGSNERTVGNWLYARNGPNGAGLVVLMRHSDAVLRAVLTLAERDDLNRAAALRSASAKMRSIMAEIDALLD